MKDNKRNIDQFFQEELGGYTEAPPALVWDNLEKRLDDKKSSKPKMFWWLYLLVAAVFVGGSMAAYFKFSKTEKNIFANEKNNSNSSIINTNNALEHKLPTDGEIINNENESGFQNMDKDLQQNTAQANGVSSNVSSTNSATSFVVNANTKELNNNAENTTLNKERENFNSSRNSKKSAQRNIANSKVNSTASAGSKSLNSKSMFNKNSEAVKSGNDENDNNNNKRNVALNALNNQPNTTGANSNFSKRPKSNSNGNVSVGSSITTESKDSKGNPINPKSEVESKPPFQPPIAEKSAGKNLPIAQAPKDKGRGLSAFPEEDEAELMKAETASEKDADFEFEKPEKEKPASKLQLQAAAVAQARAQNPLAAAPMATKEIEQTNSADEDAKSAGAASGGGGGGAAVAKSDKIKKSLNLAIGVKAGYEQGFQNITAHKNVASVFLEVALSKRLNFIMQPSLKFGKLNKQITGGVFDTFINASSTTSTRVQLLDTAGKPKGFSNYYFSQNIDSMTQSSSFNNKFMEIEIPFLFRYKVDKNFSVLAGINFIFGKTLGFTLGENRLSTSTITDSVLNVSDTVKTAIPARFAAQGISGKADAPDGMGAPVSPIRFGYTLGLSYVFNEKIMVDLLIQQNLSGTSSISNAEARRVFDQPYVRLSLGYVLFGKTKK